jgi:hypothetical protein
MAPSLGFFFFFWQACVGSALNLAHGILAARIHFC